MMIEVDVAKSFAGDVADVYSHMNFLMAGAAHLRIFTDQMVEIVAQGDNTLIRFGADSVLLMGVQAQDIWSADFL